MGVAIGDVAEGDDCIQLLKMGKILLGRRGRITVIVVLMIDVAATVQYNS